MSNAANVEKEFQKFNGTENYLAIKQGWKDIARNSCTKISDDFIRTYADKFTWANAWHELSLYQPLSESIVEEFADKIKWYELCYNNNIKLSEDCIRKVIKHIVKKRSFPGGCYDNNLEWLLMKHSVSEKFIDDFSNYLDLYHLKNYFNISKLSKNFIRKYADRLNWKHISSYLTQKDEKFIEEFAYKVAFDYLNVELFDKKFCLKHINKFTNSQKNRINFSTFEEFKNNVKTDNIDWNIVWSKKNVTEDFIRTNLNKVDWKQISRYQSLTEPFIEEFKDKIDWESISATQKLSKDFVHKYADKVNWHNIICFQHFDFEFLFNHQQQIYNMYKDVVYDKTVFKQICENKTIFKNFVNQLIDRKTGW